MANDAANPKSEILYVRLPRTLMSRVRDYAARRELSLVGALRELLEAQLGSEDQVGASQEEAEVALIRWRWTNEARDELVRQASAGGVTKHRIHVLTGIARTTLDRILIEDPGC